MNEHTLMILNTLDDATEAIYNSGYHDGYESGLKRYKPDDFDEEAIKNRERIRIRSVLRQTLLSAVSAKSDTKLVIDYADLSNLINMACAVKDEEK